MASTAPSAPSNGAASSRPMVTSIATPARPRSSVGILDQNPPSRCRRSSTKRPSVPRCHSRQASSGAANALGQYSQYSQADIPVKPSLTRPEVFSTRSTAINSSVIAATSSAARRPCGQPRSSDAASIRRATSSRKTPYSGSRKTVSSTKYSQAAKRSVARTGPHCTSSSWSQASATDRISARSARPWPRKSSAPRSPGKPSTICNTNSANIASTSTSSIRPNLGDGPPGVESSARTSGSLGRSMGMSPLRSGP